MMDEATEKRSRQIAALVEAHMEPGDVVLVVGKDDSCTLLFGKDYRDAYATGHLTPGRAFPSTMLGMQILGEFLTGQMHLCLPGEPGDIKSLRATKAKVMEYKAAEAAGTLQPSDTIYAVAAAYQQLAALLVGHLAACQPNEYRKMVEQLEVPPSQRLWTPGQPDPTKQKPS